MAEPAKVDPQEHYATKADIADLRGDMNAGFARLESKIDADIADLRSETNAGFARLESKIDADIADLRNETNAGFARLDGKIDTGLAELRGDLKWLKWIGGVLAAAVLAAFVRGLFLS